MAKEKQLSINRQEAVYLNAATNIADLMYGPKVRESLLTLFPDLDVDAMRRDFNAKFTKIIHESGWCPDPTCIEKQGKLLE